MHSIYLYSTVMVGFLRTYRYLYSYDCRIYSCIYCIHVSL